MKIWQRHTRSYLSIEDGHGAGSNGWKVDCAILPWNEGKDITSIGDGHLEVIDANLDFCSVVQEGHNWDLYDCSFESIDDLKQFLNEKTNLTISTGLYSAVQYNTTNSHVK